eukprot:5984320-Prymnesium_polylepis.1
MHLDEDMCIAGISSRSFFSALSADYAYALEDMEPKQQAAATFDALIRKRVSVPGESRRSIHSTRPRLSSRASAGGTSQTCAASWMV